MNTQMEWLTKKDEKLWKEFGQFPLFDLEWRVINYDSKNNESTQTQKKVTNQIAAVYDQKNEEWITMLERVWIIEKELRKLSAQYDKLDDELDRNPRMDMSEMRYISAQIQRLSREKMILTGWK